MARAGKADSALGIQDLRTDLLFEAIKELRAELERLDYVIQRIEALAEGRKRRGRPPKGLEAARKEDADQTVTADRKRR